MSTVKTVSGYKAISSLFGKYGTAYVEGQSAFKKVDGSYIKFYEKTASANTDDPLFVMLGASIMNQVFNGTEAIQNDINTELGSDIRIQQYALGGGRLQTLSVNIASVLDAIIIEPNRDVYCVIHIGGNDTNLIRPFTGNLYEEYEVFDFYWDLVIGEIKSRGFIPIIGNVSYRTYNGSASDNVVTEDQGTQPYNAKSWIPNIAKHARDFTFPSGIPHFQMYEKVFEEGDNAMSDGVHPNQLGVDNIIDLFKTNIVSPIVTGSLPVEIPLVNGRPTETLASIVNVNSNSVDIEWTPVNHADGIEKYDIYLDGVLNQTVLGNVNATTVSGLDDSEIYKVCIITTANNGLVSYESNDLRVLTDSPNGAKLLHYINLNKHETELGMFRVSPFSNNGRQSLTNPRSTATTTPRTGPLYGADKTGAQVNGLYYMYVETSGVAGQGGAEFIEGDAGVSGNNATMESDVFDASNNNIFFRLMYHMHFANTAASAAAEQSYMTIEGFNGTDWVEELRVTGSQQVNQGDDFLISNVDFSAYTNIDFKVRFRMIFIGTDSSAWRDFSWCNAQIWNGNPEN